MKKIVKLRTQGNCLVITITKDLIEDLKWKEGDQILIESKPQNPDSIFIGPKKIEAGKID